MRVEDRAFREIDEHVYRTLTTRAAAEGLSLTRYLRRELTHLAETPTMAEWLDEIDADRGHGVTGAVLQAAFEDLRRDRDER